MSDFQVGDLVVIVASERFHSRFLGRSGEIVRLTQPRMMAKVRVNGYSGEPVTFWNEELRVLSRKEVTVKEFA